jgi:hypothetical protein
MSFCDYDKMEFYELIWLHERMATQRQKENENEENSMDPSKVPLSRMLRGNNSG